jgi:hypothetical protein
MRVPSGPLTVTFGGTPAPRAENRASRATRDGGRLRAGLRRRSTDPVFEDMHDASLAALAADPERVVEAAETGATSFFERMRRDHPDELRAGVRRLREDIAANRAPRHAGTATVLSWTKPLRR